MAEKKKRNMSSAMPTVIGGHDEPAKAGTKSKQPMETISAAARADNNRAGLKANASEHNNARDQKRTLLKAKTQETFNRLYPSMKKKKKDD